MGKWRRTVGVLSASAVVVGILVSPAAQASAAPALNAAARYAINVPGDVLQASAGSMTEAAQLAAGQTYNWDFAESQFSSVSGTFTATPVAPETALAPADLATFDTDAATFAAPAIEAAGAAKVVAGTNVALLAFSVGALIGSSASRILGFKDEQVCEQQSTAMTVMATVLDGVDCSGWNDALTKQQRNLDKHKPTYPNTCIVEVGCWTFTHQVAMGNGTLNNVFTGPCVTENVIYSVNSGTTDADLNYLTGLSPAGCPSVEFLSLVSPPVTDFRFAVVGTTEQSAVEVVRDSGANPPRDWQCVITTTTGARFEHDSASWTEADPTVAPILCPGLPAGQVAAEMQIIEHGGGADQIIWDQATSGAYRDWLSKFPECVNGSCALVPNQLGQSCFLAGVGCDGWIDDPQRDKDYTCTYGTHKIPLDECFVYGNIFNPANQARGFVYSNPSTGAPLNIQTAPTTVDVI